MEVRQYRQGDVFVKSVNKIPVGAKKEKQVDRIILAFGEKTGHCHAIHDLDSVDVMVTPEGGFYLRVKEEVSLQHEEHGVIAIPPGNYERVIQREYSPEEIRNVAD